MSLYDKNGKMMHPGDLQEDVCKRQLNLEKILKLSKKDQKIIIKLYNDLMDAFDKQGNSFSSGMPAFDIPRVYTIYNTLIDNDYLITKREASIDKVLS